MAVTGYRRFERCGGSLRPCTGGPAAALAGTRRRDLALADGRGLEEPPGACLVGIGPEMALYLTSARRFGAPATGALPPQALLDGAGDAERLSLLFEMQITILRAEVDPPPNTRHIAVRTGKRYSKTSLTAHHGRDVARAIAECR